MADSDTSKAEDSAEKAYAAAAEAIAERTPDLEPAVEAAPAAASAPAEASPGEPVEFPAKPKRASKPRETVTAVETPAAPAVAEVPLVAAHQAKTTRPRVAAKKAVKAPAKRSAAKPAASAKPVTAKPAASAKPVTAKPALTAKPSAAAVKTVPAKLRKPAAPKIKAAAKTAPKPVKAPAKPVAVKSVKAGAAEPNNPFIAKLKEFPMDVTSTIKEAVSGAQAKAKDAFTKTSAAATEAGEFAKGNVEAFVESGKILASGLQDMGSKFVADSKSVFETATADVKALTSVKSPTDFFQMQTELLRRNIDSAVAYSSKTSEAMMKLTSDVMAPLSGRVNLAVEKIKKAA
jgi:phasin family protein